jgi:hypothetical protein
LFVEIAKQPADPFVLLEPIGNLSPAEAEAAYYVQLELTCIGA